MLVNEKISALPRELAPWADPKKPLPLADRFDPIPHIYLNLARLVSVLVLAVGFVSFFLALVANPALAPKNAVVLALGVISVALVVAFYRAHARAGGDTRRRGAFVLPEGILVIREEKKSDHLVFDWLPRAEIAAFAPQPPTKDGYSQIAVETAGGTAPYAFPSAEALESWHMDCLNAWLQTGEFSWYRYKHAHVGEAS